MKKQQVTPESLNSSASNSGQKGLQQYFTPAAWSTALGAALPEQRRTLADLHAGRGSLLLGLANSTTRHVIGFDIDPSATLGPPSAWAAACQPSAPPLRELHHGDILDLLPLLLDARCRFDLLALNPPFSLRWPAALLPEPLRKGAKTHVDSTLATLHMIPPLLTEKGEALLIANHSTLERLHQRHPEDFDAAWLWADLPNFFPGVSPDLRVAALYLAAGHTGGPARATLHATAPHEAAVFLESQRHAHLTAPCIDSAWQQDPTATRLFTACVEEMQRRRDPSRSEANVTLGSNGRLRTWIGAYHQAAASTPAASIEFLRQINRRHPLELILQRGTRMALQALLDSGIWTISPDAQAAIATALADFERDRAPLTPIRGVQLIGWIDDAEELLCTRDLPPFKAGTRYPLSTETIEWRKTQIRPRFQAGKRTEEEVGVRGMDLQISLHPPEGSPVRFLYNPAVDPGLRESHSLEILAAHFQLPAVTDISTLHPEAYAAHLCALDELEKITS